MLDCPHNCNWVYSPHSPYCQKCKLLGKYLTCGKPESLGGSYKETENYEIRYYKEHKETDSEE